MKQLKLNAFLPYLFSFCFLLTNCYTSTHLPLANNSGAIPKHSERTPLPKTVYSVDTNNDGNYEAIELAKENFPKPIQGKDQWARDFFGSIRYPPQARQNGIQGRVILDIKVDEMGKVTNVGIKEGISMECNEEAKRAFIQSTQRGYLPLIVNNIPTKFQMELPVGFWLE